MLVAPAGTVSGTTGINASAPGSGTSTVIVANNVTGTTGDGVFSSTSNGLNTVSVTAGTVKGAQSAVAVSNVGTGDIAVGIGAGAVLQGGTFYGLSILGGGANLVVNSGTITGTNGLSTIGTSTNVFNFGSIVGTGGIAVSLQGSSNTFVMSGAAAQA